VHCLGGREGAAAASQPEGGVVVAAGEADMREGIPTRKGTRDMACVGAEDGYPVLACRARHNQDSRWRMQRVGAGQHGIGGRGKRGLTHGTAAHVRERGCCRVAHDDVGWW
jgi:hypothetical protein